MPQTYDQNKWASAVGRRPEPGQSHGARRATSSHHVRAGHSVHRRVATYAHRTEVEPAKAGGWACVSGVVRRASCGRGIGLGAGVVTVCAGRGVR